MKIETVLDQLDLGSSDLPVFQRRDVWNRDQARSFTKDACIHSPGHDDL